MLNTFWEKIEEEAEDAPANIYIANIYDNFDTILFILFVSYSVLSQYSRVSDIR